jgi:hypothetical protein
MQIPLIGPAYRSRSLNVQADRMINLYPEVTEKKVTALMPTPGLETWVDLGVASPIRGQFVAGGYLWAVCGSSLYRVTQSGVKTLIGSVAGSGPVGMAENGQQLMIGAGDYGYIVTLSSSTLAAISDADFPGADWVTYMDGCFIVGRFGTPSFYKSALYDGTSWDALDFASAEGMPDDVVIGLADHRELWLFGEQSTEPFTDTGAADFPYERINGAYMEHGIAAAYSAAKIDNSVFWLGADDKGQGMVWRAQGYAPQRISTHAIEYAINSYSVISDAIAYTYQADGHTFYVLTFPTANATWVYDAATQMWHERAYRNPTTGQQERHRGVNHTFFAGYHVIGDHSNGKLYRLRNDISTDAGDAIRRERVVGLPGKDNERVSIPSLELLCETGIGLASGQGSDPQAMLQISKDGGHTWGPERWRSMGAIGEYGKRVIWNRNGEARRPVLRIAVTDPVPVAWIALSVRDS